MPILLPEKIIFSTITAGYNLIKGNLVNYLSDIFDPDLVPADYVTKAQNFFTQTKILLSYGYPLEDSANPGWYVILMGGQHSEDYIDNFEASSADASGGNLVETYGIQLAFTVKLISSSTNMDGCIMMDALARYVLNQAKEQLSGVGIEEVSLSFNEMDPVLQFFPNTAYHRAITITGKGYDQWTLQLPLVTAINATMQTFGSNTSILI